MKTSVKSIFTLAVIIISALTSFSSFTNSDIEPHLIWYTDFELAQKDAQSQNKQILLSFSGSDWCVNCIKLEKILFESKEFQTYAKENLILVSADFPRKKKNVLPAEQQKHNDALAKKHNPKGIFPSVVAMNSNAKVLGKMKHPLSNPDTYISNLKSIYGK